MSLALNLFAFAGSAFVDSERCPQYPTSTYLFYHRPAVDLPGMVGPVLFLTCALSYTALWVFLAVLATRSRPEWAGTGGAPGALFLISLPFAVFGWMLLPLSGHMIATSFELVCPDDYQKYTSLFSLFSPDFGSWSYSSRYVGLGRLLGWICAVCALWVSLRCFKILAGLFLWGVILGVVGAILLGVLYLVDGAVRHLFFN